MYGIGDIFCHVADSDLTIFCLEVIQELYILYNKLIRQNILWFDFPVTDFFV